MEDPLKPKPVPLAAETVLWFEFLLDPNKITQHLQCKNPGMRCNEATPNLLDVTLATLFHILSEPSAVELIMQFISMTPDTAIASTVVTPGSDLQNLAGASVGANATTPAASAALNVPLIAQQQRQGDVHLQLTRKQLALKILELKVATWLRWDLDALEKGLPVLMQLGLLRDLCTISYGRVVSIPFPNDFDFKICKFPFPHLRPVRLIVCVCVCLCFSAPSGNERAARFALTIYHRMILRLQLIKDSALKSPRPLM